MIKWRNKHATNTMLMIGFEKGISVGCGNEGRLELKLDSMSLWKERWIPALVGFCEFQWNSIPVKVLLFSHLGKWLN